MQQILERYETFEHLKETALLFRKNNKQPPEDLHYLKSYRRFLLLRGKINKLVERMATSSTTNRPSNMQQNDPFVSNNSQNSMQHEPDPSNLFFCHNCHRQEISNENNNMDEGTNHQQLYLTQRTSDAVARRRKFKNVVASSTNIRTYHFCRQCDGHLKIDGDQSEFNSFALTWPGFIWYLLTDNEILSHYSAEFLWKLIPQKWRKWWLPSLKSEHSRYYSNVTLEFPTPIILDRTDSKNEWNLTMSENALPNVAKCCNKHLLPTILCPWGCTEYIHKHGSVPFYSIIQRYMPKVQLCTTKFEDFKKVLTARDDYVRSDVTEYNSWLLNPMWKVMPTVVIDNKLGPISLTCNDHDKGETKYMLHPCRQPIHNIPALRPDQLAPCVNRPRTVKPIKKSMFSTTYQMHEQKGSFNGIDTCSVTLFGKFDFQSSLSAVNDARSLSQRPDIHAHLQTLVNEKVISDYVKRGREKDAICRSQNIDYEPYFSASTYTPLHVAMAMLKENAQPRYSKSPEVGMRTEEITTFKVGWPQNIYPCQTLNSHGAHPHLTPKLATTDPECTNFFHISRIWSLSSMLLTVEPLWNKIVSMNSYSRESWHGWLLTYLSKKSIHHVATRSEPNDPFKFGTISSMNDFASKLEPCLMQSADIYEHQTYIDIFNDLNEVRCFDANLIQSSLKHHFMSNVNGSTDEVIIIENYGTETNGLASSIKLEDNSFYELRHLNQITIPRNDQKWVAQVSMRHGKNHSDWWHADRKSEMYVKRKHHMQIMDGSSYTLVYVKVLEPKLKDASQQIMAHIGGQTNVQCIHHKLPMILSTFRKGKCFCGRKEYYRCADFNCNMKCCKRCLDVADLSEINYVTSSGLTNDGNMLRETPNTSGSDNNGDSADDSDMWSCASDTDSDNTNSESHTVDDDAASLFDLSDSDDDDEPPPPLGIADPSYSPLIIDDYNEYVTTADAPDFNVITDTCADNPYHDVIDQVPTTDAGIYPFNVTETSETSGALKDIIVTGNVLLNQCGTLLTRNSHQIKGSSRGKFLMQKICASTIGTSVPLLQPEASLFPSIFWKMVPNDGVIAGAIPTPLLSEKCAQYGFQSLPQHLRSRLTNSGSTSSTDPHYITHCYDMLTNLSATHLDTRIAMNRGLTAGSDTLGGLGVRGGNDSAGSALLGSIDSNQMVKNLCASQQLHPSSFFCTFTCAQARHFGTKILKEWIDGDTWKKDFPEYNDLIDSDQREIDNGMQQCAAGLLLRNWQEVCKIFIDYLRLSPTSPFRRTGSIFARNEYQKDAGNLSHIHLMIEVKWEELTTEEREFVDKLIRTNHIDICPSDDVEQYLNEGIFKTEDEKNDLQEYAKKILRHNCSSRCQERTGDNEFRCRHSNNNRDNPDPKNDHFMPLPNSLPDTVKQKLVDIGLIDAIEINDLGYEIPFKCKDDFFHPSRHIPATNPNEDVNMSPVESYTFCVCKSMQNIQLIKGTGGCNKYVCKYVGKIDEQNFVVVKANPNDNGNLITQSNFLHNTKVTGSKINEDAKKESSRDRNKPTGRKISLMEMLHVMLKYPEVYTDLKFVEVPTYPLAFRKSTGVRAKMNPSPSNTNARYGDTEDSASTVPYMISVRNNASLEEWRKHTDVETTLIQDLYKTKYPLDAITRFSIRPPELRKLFNNPGEYFRWFTYSKKPVTDKFADDSVTDDLRHSSFIDGIQYQVKIRRNAVDEVIQFINTKDLIGAPEEEHTAIELMLELCEAIQNISNNGIDNGNQFESNIDQNIVDNNSKGLLPICVFSQIRPTGGINFILHILLSMGRYDNEMEMTVQPSLRLCLREAKLIGPEDDIISLQKYSNDLLLRYITEQLKYFSNSRRLIIHWIEVAASVFDNVILNDEIPVTEMPPVQLTAMLAIKEEAEMKFITDMKLKVATAVKKEVGTLSCQGNTPSLEDIIACNKDDPFQWDPIASHTQHTSQSVESFTEQKIAITVTINAIDRYASLSSNNLSVKNIGIRGFPGGGKTWCGMYCLLYAMSKGLNCLPTAVMAKRATQLGGTHWHKFFCLPVEKRLTPHRIAEQAINKLLFDKVRYNAVMTLDVILADEFGQLSAEFISAIDIILRNLRKSNTIFGGVLIIGTLDHTQIQPWEGRPFLTSPQIIPTFTMVNLEYSVRTNNVHSQRIQTIARMNYRHLMENPLLVTEFSELASTHFTFVENWEDRKIVPSTFRVYSKRVPAVDAAKEFIANVRRNITNPNSVITCEAKDLQKARYTTSDWRNATSETSNKLEEKVKPPKQLLFFRGAVYECTYNHKEGIFNQSQIALLYDLPAREDVRNWKPIKVLIAPPALKDVEFDMTLPKEHFLSTGFTEIEIRTCPERPVVINRNLQAQRKQYGLKHRVTGTIHAAMGDTYESMASMISTTDKHFGLWDKGQLIVILSRTRDPSKTIFVGDKEDTLRAFRALLTKRTQWTDFMEHILDVITINTSTSRQSTITAVPEHYPFQVCNMELPQCNTGFVYMLISLRRREYTYFGMTNCIRTRIVQHNSGYGASATENYRLRPFAMMGYICGFCGDRDMMYCMELKWKLRRDELIQDGNNDPRDWARCGEDIIREQHNQSVGAVESNLKLILLFR